MPRSIQTRTISVPTSPVTKVFPSVDYNGRHLGGSGDAFTVDPSTEVLTSEEHGLANDATVRLKTTGTLPAGLAVDVLYYVVNKTDDTFQVSLTQGGAAVDITDQGNGVHSWEDASENEMGWLFHEIHEADQCIVRIDPTDSNFATASLRVRCDGYVDRYTDKYGSNFDAYNDDVSSTGWRNVDKDNPLIVDGLQDMLRLRMFASGAAIVAAIELVSSR